jgi:hypothetical protein
MVEDPSTRHEDSRFCSFNNGWHSAGELQWLEQEALEETL